MYQYLNTIAIQQLLHKNYSLVIYV